MIDANTDLAVGIAFAKELSDLEAKRNAITLKFQDGRMCYDWANLVLQQTFIDGKIEGLKEAYKIVKRL